MIAAALLAAGVALAAGPAPAPPRFPWRGVLEGFYGRPWTWAQRRRLVGWLPKHHFNLYAIAPKDDPEQRARWREPLKERTKAELADLAARAGKRGVALAWTLSPGLDFTGGRADVDAAVEKFASVCSLGIEHLTLAFDDTRADPAQIGFADAVRRRLLARCPAARWTFVPAQYWAQAAPSTYLDEVSRSLDPAFLVAWTGPSVINRSIAAEAAARFKAYLKHGLVLGDNYPVQDRLVDEGRLFLGPLTGRDPRLPEFDEGYLANASPLLEASLIPLATAGDYAWDPSHYDAAASWRRSLAEAGGPDSGTALRLLAGLCAGSWLAPAGPTETDALVDAIRSYVERKDGRPLTRKLLSIEVIENLETVPQPLRAELLPWSREAARQARRLLAAAGGAKGRLPAGPPSGRAIVADQGFSRAARTVAGEGASAGSITETIRGARAAARAEDAALLQVDLDRLVECGRRASTGDAGLWPWPWIVGRYAAAARDALQGRPWGGLRLALLRWRTRARLVPLLMARRVVEDYLARREKEWGLPSRGRPLSAPERAWVAWRRLSAPNSWEARLSGDATRRRAFEDLIAFEGEFWPAPTIEEETPWLRKIGDFGEAGLAALDAKSPPTDWETTRERLASGNGLEILVELKLELEALARGEKGEVPFPADPADAF